MRTFPRVYADFNAMSCAQVVPGSSLVDMEITGFGTLFSLARQGLRLQEGMALVLYETGDIECEAVAHFDPRLKDPAGRMGAWVARLNPKEIRDCTEEDQHPREYPCLVCGADFAEQLARGLRYDSVCPKCGSSVMAPMRPPHELG